MGASRAEDLLVDLYPSFKALPARLEELVGAGRPQPAAVDLSPVTAALEAVLAELRSAPQPQALDLGPLAERLDALVELGKKKPGKPDSPMFSSVGGRAATITDDHGNTAAISNAAPSGSEYALLVRPIGGGSGGVQAVQDIFLTGEILADQALAGSAVTFTFANGPVDLLWVRVDGTSSGGRADPFGGTPSSSVGIRCDDGTPNPINVKTSSVEVWGPTGTAQVWGFRY